LGWGHTGHRTVLGISVSLSEAEVHWRDFFAHLQQRGLTGILLFISDDHASLKAAREARFPGVPWQRYQFHLQQNAGHYVPRLEMRREVATDLRAIFESADRLEAERRLRQVVEKYAQRAPKLSTWVENNVAESFTVFAFPEAHRRRLRTSNLMERISKEIKRRTRVAALVPNEASLLRLISAVLMEISEEGETENTYLRMENLNPSQ
jgi:putative transposase